MGVTAGQEPYVFEPPAHLLEGALQMSKGARLVHAGIH
jgi:hypothetical protein